MYRIELDTPRLELGSFRNFWARVQVGAYLELFFRFDFRWSSVCIKFNNVKFGLCL